MVVQAATPVSALLLRISGSDTGAGSWGSGTLVHHQQPFRRVASGSGHRTLPSVSGGSSQTAAKLCHPGHELCAKPASNRTAEERWAGGPLALHGCGSSIVSLWDSPPLCGLSEQGAGQEGHAAVRCMACVCRGSTGSGCTFLWCDPVLQEEPEKKPNTQEPKNQDSSGVQCLHS